MVKAQYTMAACEALVHCIHVSFNADAWTIHVRQEHGGLIILRARHDDDVVSAIGSRNKPFTPI